MSHATIDHRRRLSYRSFVARYRERMEHVHGWEVALPCPWCGLEAPPVFGGWSPSGVVQIGDRSTIYAHLSCQRCGADLKEAAGTRLHDLFEGVGSPRGTKRSFLIFSALIVAPELVGVLLWLSTDWRGLAGVFMRAPLVYLGPAILWFNWQIHSARHRCPCGRPNFKFMGLLGRSSCYRCSTCGSLIRLRD